MMNLWKIYRPVWQFLLVFFVTYGVFSGLYFGFLDYWSSRGFTVDPITRLVGAQLQYFLNFIGFVVFMSLLIVLVYYYNPWDYRALFYVRLFLIHPLLLLLLIPIFLVLNPQKKT